MKPWPAKLVELFPPNPDWRRTDGLAGRGPLEALDAAKPLPHPGFRPGQIWGTEKGDAFLIQTVDNKLAILVSGTQPGSVETVYLGPGWDFGSVDDLYLVCDPACPHLAPWSPV